ncbi:oligosaccharide flippase family protein [Cryobacterium sp. M91]|uniref:oligosaccharide flippase family protein n=1 Tax=Cryobacterium sp. M91 TaxID=2048294 RepID=UPI000CE4F11D|nr:oligosaccharide flippase family protein [Cryobacterium sp. M91]
MRTNSSHIWAPLGQVPVFVVAGFTSLVAAGLLGPSTWGVVSTINATVALITVISALGYPTQIARNPNILSKPLDLLRRIPLLILVVGATALLALRLVAAPGSVIGEAPLAHWAIYTFLLLLSIALTVNEWVLSLFQGLERFRDLAVLRLLAVTLPGLAVVIVASISADLGKALLALVFSNLLLSVILTVIFSSATRRGVQTATADERVNLENRKFAIKPTQLLGSYLTSVALLLALRVDLIVASVRSDAAAVGTFALALMLAETAWFVANGAAISMLPRIAKAAGVDQASLMDRSLWWSLLAATLTSAVLVGVVAPVLQAVLGRDFDDLFWNLLVLAPGMIAFVVAKLRLTQLIGHNLWIQTIALCAVVIASKLALNLFLPEQFGPLLPATATSVSYVFGAIVVAIVTKQIFNRRRRRGSDAG